MEAEPSGAVRNWWRRLHKDRGDSRAAKARLRRCSSILEALLLEATHDLIMNVRRTSFRSSRDFEQRLAVLAMTLAHVDGASPISIARALGQTAGRRAATNGDRPRLSPARFGALLRAAHTRDWDAFARRLRRALAILGDAPIDVRLLIDDVLFLNQATLQRWTYDYWQTRAPTQMSDDETTEPDPSEMDTTP